MHEYQDSPICGHVPSKMRKPRRVRICATLSNDTVAWIDAKIRDRTFASVSHALEFAIYRLIAEEQQSNAE